MAETLTDTTISGGVRHDSESRRLLARASESIAKGASSTMRVLDYHLPLVIERAEGAVVWDADGNDLIDMNMGYGPLLFGHRPRLVTDAIARELGHRGTLLGFADTLSLINLALAPPVEPGGEGMVGGRRAGAPRDQEGEDRRDTTCSDRHD